MAGSRSASSSAACAAASTWWWRRRVVRSTTSSAGSLRFDAVSVVILDEADEMLDMGFADDLEAILTATPAERQTALFSATISPTISRIAKRHLRDPARIKVHAEQALGRRCRARPPGRLRRPPDRQAGRALPHPRCRGPDLGARVRTDARRGRRPRRGAERQGPRCRRAPRWPLPGGARPDHGPVPGRLARRPGRHRCRRPRSRHRARLARRQLRRPVQPRCLRPPDRPDRACRSRGRGDHPGRAARAPADAQHRERRPTRSSRSPTCRPWPTSGSGGPRSFARTCARRSSATGTTGTAASSSR